MEALIFPLLLGVLFYFMLIRPQRKRMEQQRKLVANLSPDDEVVTIGGMWGTIRALEDDYVELEASPGTVIRFNKTAIARVVTSAQGDSVDTSSEEEGQ